MIVIWFSFKEKNCSIDFVYDFLRKHPSIWEIEILHIVGSKILTNLKVINDTAERVIKLITDYSNWSFNEEESH
jgi:hypothetical protein